MLSTLKHIVRQSKITYMVYNMLHKDQLRHNPPLYKKYGIRKQYFSPISSKDFLNKSAPDVKAQESEIKKLIEEYEFDVETKESLENYNEEGYAILRNFISKDRVHRINQEISNLRSDGKLKLRYGDRKIMFSHRFVKSVEELGSDPDLLSILNVLLDGTPVLYQSINFPNKGSEQKLHSDSVHLTTYPRGGMVGVWIALEKINHENGPIFYLPGSHKFPYLMNRDYNNEGNFFKLGEHDYTAYEDMVQREMSRYNLQERIFEAEPGDVLIWHANLMHGGQAHLDPDRTRKSLVMHYFRDECIWYHEISQRPALYPAKVN